MRKYLKIMIILSISTIILIITGCTKKSSSKENAKKDLPQIRIGVDILKPFFYIDRNGNYAGIDADIAKEACKRAGYQPQFVEIPWSERDRYLEKNKQEYETDQLIQDMTAIINARNIRQKVPIYYHICENLPNTLYGDMGRITAKKEQELDLQSVNILWNRWGGSVKVESICQID